MSESVNYEGHRSAIRSKRLMHDLSGLSKDALEGVMAQPLDSSLYHWQVNSSINNQSIN